MQVDFVVNSSESLIFDLAVPNHPLFVVREQAWPRLAFDVCDIARNSFEYIVTDFIGRN